MNTPAKSPSLRRVVVIAGAWAVLASAVTPVFAEPREKARFTKKGAAPASSRGGGGGGAFSLERTITAVLRP